MKSSRFPKTLRALRLRKDISQSELARRMGITPQSIQQWESGRSLPRGERLNELAKQLGVNVSGLLDEINDKSALDNVLAWEKGSPASRNEVEVPAYKETPLNDGSGKTEITKSKDRSLRFSRESLEDAGVKPEDAGCCYIADDSMAPALPDGAVVAIDTSQKVVSDGKLYAIDYDGLLRVRYVYRLPGGKLRLKCANPEYEDEEVSFDAGYRIEIIGRVFWYSSFL